MSGMPRMTVSAPRELMREFTWLCHRREKSASEVLREFMQNFVDSRFAEIEARDLADAEMGLVGERSDMVRTGSAEVLQVCCETAACGPRGGDP